MNLLLINTMMGDFSGDLMLPWKSVEGFPANMFFQPPQLWKYSQYSVTECETNHSADPMNSFSLLHVFNDVIEHVIRLL